MRIVTILAAMIVISGVAFAQGAANRQDRVVLEVIQLNYLDAQTVIAIFGGTIIPNYQAQRMLPSGPRGGYGGSYGYSRVGSGIGGSYTTPRSYGYGTQPQTGYGGNQGYGYYR